MRLYKKTLFVLVPSVLLSLNVLMWVDGAVWPVLVPITLGALTVVWLWVQLWNTDRVLPLFDIGAVCVGFSACYALIPPLGLVVSNFTYSVLTDYRLQIYEPTPRELAPLVWRYCVYLLSLSIAYAWMRGGKSAVGEAVQPPTRGLTRAMLLTGVAGIAVSYAAAAFYGLQVAPIYDESLGEHYEKFQALPLVVRQFIGKLSGILFVIKLALAMTLLAYWRHPWCRAALLGWLALEIVSYAFRMGARTELVLFSIGAVLLYHRMVRPLRATVAVGLLAALFAAFMIFGVMRGGASLGDNIERLAHVLSTEDVRGLASMTNEFQTVFVGSYDLFEMKRGGLIQEVPWQVYLSELLNVLPQQILPFEKIDVQDWFLAASTVPSYFFYGPVNQAILGLDWLELIVRGAALAAMLAGIHRWYVRRAHRFWPTLFYAWLALWSYYTVRSSTLYILVFILYNFLPAFLMIVMVQRLLRMVGASARQVRVARMEPLREARGNVG